MLTPHMKTVLRGVLKDIQRLDALPPRPGPQMDRAAWRETNRERGELDRFGVRHDLEGWLGYPPSASDSAVFSRTLRQMEDRGLVERVSRWGGRRTTHLRLTPAGRRLARELAEEESAEPIEPIDIESLTFEPFYLPEEGDVQ